jgi:hypothetical protein
MEDYWIEPEYLSDEMLDEMDEKRQREEDVAMENN